MIRVAVVIVLLLNLCVFRPARAQNNFTTFEPECALAYAYALRSFNGIQFRGQGPKDGGALANSAAYCGYPPIPGTGPDDKHITFNCNGTLIDGGKPVLPETIILPGLTSSPGAGLDLVSLDPG